MIAFQVEEAKVLERRVKTRTAAVRKRRRAGIVLLAVRGLKQEEIAAEAGVSRMTARLRGSTNAFRGLRRRAGPESAPTRIHRGPAASVKIPRATGWPAAERRVFGRSINSAGTTSGTKWRGAASISIPWLDHLLDPYPPCASPVIRQTALNYAFRSFSYLQLWLSANFMNSLRSPSRSRAQRRTIALERPKSDTTTCFTAGISKWAGKSARPTPAATRASALSSWSVLYITRSSRP